MGKKSSKAQKPAGSPDQTAAPGSQTPPAGHPDPTVALGISPLYTGNCAQGIRIDQALGIPICFGSWTSSLGPGGEPTRICIQEWTGDGWEVIEVIGPEGKEKGDPALPLDPDLFRGRYLGERVLSVFKPAAKSKS